MFSVLHLISLGPWPSSASSCHLPFFSVFTPLTQGVRLSFTTHPESHSPAPLPVDHPEPTPQRLSPVFLQAVSPKNCLWTPTACSPQLEDPLLSAQEPLMLSLSQGLKAKCSRTTPASPSSPAIAAPPHFLPVLLTHFRGFAAPSPRCFPPQAITSSVRALVTPKGSVFLCVLSVSLCRTRSRP